MDMKGPKLHPTLKQGQEYHHRTRGGRASFPVPAMLMFVPPIPLMADDEILRLVRSRASLTTILLAPVSIIYGTLSVSAIKLTGSCRRSDVGVDLEIDCVVTGARLWLLSEFSVSS